MTSATGLGGGGSAQPGSTDRPLSRCVRISEDEFASAYWAKQPLFSRAVTGSEFADLFSADAVDELISRRGLRTPFVRMAKHGKVLDPARFTRPGGAGATVSDQVADDKVLGLLADGASLVLQGLHRVWPPLIDFGGQLSEQLGHPAQINAYVTPAENQGFSAHYDTHDVFVLQIAGRKSWRIHPPVIPDPLPDQTWEANRASVEARATEPALLDLTMTPGDVLYLPRGYLHQAAALGESSIHLTVGIHPINRHDLLRELVAVLADEPLLRRSLPMGIDLADPTALEPALTEVRRRLRELLDDADGGQAAEVGRRIGRRLRRDTRPAPITPLRQLDALSELTGQSSVRLRPGLRVDVSEGPDGVRLEMLDRYLSLPFEMAPAVTVLLSGRPVRVDELPGLDLESRLTLVRRLLRESVVIASGVPR